MKLQEYQNMICVKSRSDNMPATVTNKRSLAAEGLVDDLIKKDERGSETNLLRI